VKGTFPQLPVELPRLKTAASTNAADCSGGLPLGRTYNPAAMADTNDIAQIASRVDRLLLRHEELQRTNDLLSAQVAALTSERDLLRSRLSAARARIDALLDRLPDSTPSTPSSP
jgi:cell division protein ZapB